VVEAIMEQEKSAESFQGKKNYFKKVTTLYHDLNNGINLFTSNRVFQIDEKELMFIDFNMNIFLIYNTVSHKTDVIECDKKLIESNVFIAAHYSRYNSELILCDHESNIYEMLLIDKKNLILKQKYTSKEAGIIEYIEIYESVDAYACDVKLNCIHVFKKPSSSKITEVLTKRITRAEISEPSCLKIRENFLFVICKENNVSYILIIDKFGFNSFKRILMDDWFQPTGLYISKTFDYLLTTASKKTNRTIINEDYDTTENEYLLIIDLDPKYLYPVEKQGEQQDDVESENEKCKIISEIELDFNLINDFHVLKNDRVLFLLNHVDKPLALIDLN
jgi:hypothetical protein